MAKSTSTSPSHRTTIVFASLIATLAVTSILLLAVAPAPLTPTNQLTLMNVADADGMALRTQVPIQPGRWTSILIRYAADDTARTSDTDHFTLTDDAGEPAFAASSRWAQQLPAAPPPSAAAIDPNCVTVCINAGSDRTYSQALVDSANKFVQTLQTRLNIRPEQVWTLPRQ